MRKMMKRITALIATIIFSTVLATAGYAAEPADLQLLANVNAVRQEHGLPVLEIDERLDADAVIRAKEVAALYSHTRPDGTEWYTVDLEKAYGENISNRIDYANIVDTWSNDEIHYGNIMNARFTHVGVAHVGDRWVMLFGY